MAAYVQLGDVRTYYEEDGDGRAAGAPAPRRSPTRARSSATCPGSPARFRVYRPDRRGHGRTPDVEGPITYEQMAEDTIAFLEQVVGGPAYLVGHSDGAPVGAARRAARAPTSSGALVFARRRLPPRRLGRPARSTSTRRPPRSSSSTTARCRPTAPSTSRSSPRSCDRMHREEPTLTPADLAGYPGPALVMVGDGDDEIPLEHTLALRDGLPDAQLAVVPGTRPRPVRREARALQPDRPRLPQLVSRPPSTGRTTPVM